MELNFERIDNLYVAEFEVTSDFNLHIERDTEGRLDIYQRTAGGQYEYINDIGWLNRRLVYDYDFTALVYPKYIKIVTSVLPLVATITTDGEVNELKYQEKSVEITSNGTTKVIPDAGYNGLAQVNVKVDVPQGGGGDASTIEYVDISTADENFKTNTMNYSIATKAIMMGGLVVLPSSSLIDMINHGVPVDDILAVSVDINMAILLPQGELLTIKDVLIANGSWETYSSLPRITKEEFYHIPQDEIWTLNTQDDYKTAWDKLYPLIERYGADYINENKLSLAPWYKSLTLESEWGTIKPSEIVEYRSGLNGEANEDSIQFNGYALTKRYEDGGIMYYLFFDPA